jgi:NADPH:quinone reductase-like Zn-dependent oxidoreductase
MVSYLETLQRKKKDIMNTSAHTIHLGSTHREPSHVDREATRGESAAIHHGSADVDSRAEGTMRAIVQRTYGTADVLKAERIKRPTIASNEVLVQVRAAALDRGTWHLMAGYPYGVRLVTGLRAPKNPVGGLDAAGIVVAVGAKVTRFVPGDAVFGFAKGSFAEFAAAREDKLAYKPVDLSFEAASAVAVSGLTALRGLFDVGRLQDGQRVLILGASGGVGTYAVQLAKAGGGHVTGVCSSAKVDLVRSLGADEVIDYTTDDFSKAKRPYDLILDIGGDASLRRLRSVLAPRGTLVIVGSEAGGRWFGMGRQLRTAAMSPFVGQRLKMLLPNEHFSGLERLRTYIEAGQVSPSIDSICQLEQVPDAMRKLIDGRVRGKIVVQIASPAEATSAAEPA